MHYGHKTRFLKTIDGDTIDVEIDVGFRIFSKQRLRLARIDACEMHSKVPEEKERAIRARDYIETVFKEWAGKPITIHTEKTDKYGRYVAEVSIGGVNLSDLLLDAGIVNQYPRPTPIKEN